jgi:hypothetical protein
MSGSGIDPVERLKSERLKSELLKRSGGRCESCGKPLSGVGVSIRRVSAGKPKYEASDFNVLCPECSLREKLLERSKGVCESCGISLMEGMRIMRAPPDFDPAVVCPECYRELKRREEHRRFMKYFGVMAKDYRRGEYVVLNGILFFAIVVPALTAVLIGAPMNFFYWMLAVWVHESGHGMVCTLVYGVFCSLAGFLAEMALTAVPACICFLRKESYTAGFILLMCVGMSLDNNGLYMQSAEAPHGRGAFGLPLTESTHDWSVVFRNIGIVKHSYEIGRFTQESGHAIAIIGLAACFLSFIPAFTIRPGGLFRLLGAAGIISAGFFILQNGSYIEIGFGLALGMLLALSYKAESKGGKSD